MGKHNRKPTDPQEIARKRAERLATETEIGRLRKQGATVKLDRSRRIVSAYRASPFVKLRDSDTITPAQAGAAERLCEDWAQWKGLDGRPERSEVPGDGSQTAQIVTDRMLSGGRRVRRVLDLVGPLDRDLLGALVGAAVEEDRPIPWRDIVRRVCGVRQSVRQSQMVVAALENLSRAYALH